MSRIITRDSEGRENGWLIPLWNALDQPGFRPEQVYLTVVKAGMCKGPHLHKKRRGFFVCVKGSVRIVTFHYGTYWTRDLGEQSTRSYLAVSPGYPCAIYNTGIEDAYVINMPSPAWSKEDPDDWPVKDWKHPKWWKPSVNPPVDEVAALKGYIEELERVADTEC